MKAFKILLGSFLIAILLVAALAIPVWYVYSQGNRFVRESEQVARNRALEMGITLNTLSGESLYYDNLIALSHTMHMVVRQNQTRNDAFEIREIFLVDNDGRLIAHSDIAKLASDSGVSYDPEIFRFGQLRFKGDPLSLEVTERVKPEFGPLITRLGLAPLFEGLLARMLPGLTASDYHLAGSVYMPDEALPSGSLHILIHNRNAAGVLGQYTSTVLEVLAISVVGAVLLWAIFTIFLAVLVNRQSPPPSLDEHRSLSLETENDASLDDVELSHVDMDDADDRLDETSGQETGIDREFEPVDDLPFENVRSLEDYRDKKKAVIQPEETTDVRSKIYDAVPLDRI